MFFIDIFIIQREKCENSNALLKHIYQSHSQQNIICHP